VVAPYADPAHCAGVVPPHSAGRVFVVAGEGPVFDDVARALMSAGGLVAVVSRASTIDDAGASFRVDPTDVDAWERIVPHVEQRLGPVDAVVADIAVHALVLNVFAPDLRRRGHGDVVTVDGDAGADAVLRSLADTL
jgi:hypothetical protein